MSIASEISRLQTAKANLKTAIENKGVAVPASTKLDGYASLVDQISSGSSSYTVTLSSILPSGAETITYTGTESGTVNIINGTGSVQLQTGTYTFSSSNTFWTSGTIAITANTTINCYYGTPLYWFGNECTSLTGGWSRFSSTGTFTKGASYMNLLSDYAGAYRFAGANNQINLSGFTRLSARWLRDGASSRSGVFGTATSQTESSWTQQESQSGVFTETTNYITLENTGTLYVRIAENGVSSNGTGVRFFAIWLE